MLWMPFTMLYWDPFLLLNLDHQLSSSMSCDWVTFDLDGYYTIMPGRYLEHWFNSSYCCLLLTVSGVCEESAIPFDVAILFLIPSIWKWKVLFVHQFQNIISVSGSLSQMMKLWVNLKSVILRWSSVIPNAMIGDPSAVFNSVVVGCMGVIKLSSINWYVEYLIRGMLLLHLNNGRLTLFSSVYCDSLTIHN